MNIRAITVGAHFPFLQDNDTLELFMEDTLENCKSFFEEMTERVNMDVQSTRLCSQPLFSYEEHLIYQNNLQDTLGLINTQFGIVQRNIKKYGIDYFASCMMLGNNLKDFGLFEKLLLNEVPNFIHYNDLFFTSLPAASTINGINLSALRNAAKIIKRNAEIDPMNNLKFCVSANVGPNTPFFPAAYHLDTKPGFSIALEMADEVSRVFRNATDIFEAKNLLRKKFDEIYEFIVSISEELATKYNMAFKGIDFSPAPYPQLARSIGYALEKLKFDIGSHGSLFPIALITNCIPSHKPKVLGFSGFMQPVLEDYVIARNVAEKKITLDTLLLNSTMCGTGLDCIPLPGTITEQELFYILLDVCTVSVVLNKPLTARLMPIPGKKAGDDVDFDFEYFAKSKIMDYRKLTDPKKDDLFESKDKFFHFI